MVPKTKVLAVQVTGPLSAYAAEVKTALEKRGYTPLTVAGKLRLMNRLSRWLREREIPPGELNDEHLAVFVELLNSKPGSTVKREDGKPPARYLPADVVGVLTDTKARVFLRTRACRVEGVLQSNCAVIGGC